MSYVIWKKVVDPLDLFIEVPGDAVLLYASEQGSEVCIWFKCNPVNPLRRIPIRVVGTGHGEVEPEDRYLGTAKLDAFGRKHSLIFHVFEKA